MKTPSDIPQQPQDQRALLDQLKDLIEWADRLGMYDAADYLTRGLWGKVK